MPDPESLAVDLHDLWFTANSLRDMRGAHTDAESTVSGCNPAAAFDRPAGIGYDGMLEAWQSLQESIVAMLGTNASSLGDTATALDLCVESYTSTDAEVKREFDKRKADIPYE